MRRQAPARAICLEYTKMHCSWEEADISTHDKPKERFFFEVESLEHVRFESVPIDEWQWWVGNDPEPETMWAT